MNVGYNPNSMRSGRRCQIAKWVKAAALVASLALTAFPQKPKKEDNQVLQLPKDLPATVEGDPRHFSFYVTPLGNKGLLSKQVRDALSALSHEAKGDPILRIRAFVAGSGDSRRVRDLVSGFFTDHKLPLPVLSLVHAGVLPEDSQVVMEAIAAGKKENNPQGLAFLAAQPASADDPTGPVSPLAAKSLAALAQAVKTAGSDPSDVLRVSCFLSSLDEVAAVRKMVDQAYPKAAANFVQPQRAPARSLAACEAVAKLRLNTGTPLRVMNADGSAATSGSALIALVSSPKVVLTGTQVSFGYEEKDARLAFQRLGKSLEQGGVSLHSVAFAHFYPLAPVIATQVEKIRGDFFDAAHPPASSMLLFEGLPSMNAGFAIDVVAVK
jgi:enamine deaminase RidA (YjgF/YER057c/UK114 family)